MKKPNKLFYWIAMECITYVPIAIILGNLLPPLGLFKIHWIYIGAIFIFSSFASLTFFRFYAFMFGFAMLFLIHLLIAIEISIPQYIDFIAGPILFFFVTNSLLSHKFSWLYLKKVRNRFLYTASIPIAIAFLQYIKIVPIEFLNATYVNDTIFAGEVVLRVNGFLFHGVELAVLIFFFFVNIAILSSQARTYVLLLVLLFFEFVTKIKTGILTSLAFLTYYAYFIDVRYRFIKAIVIIVIGISSASLVYLLIPDLQLNRIYFDSRDFRFPDQLFTGRGIIWNIYLRGISDFNFFQLLFGAGFGSAEIIFKNNSGGIWMHSDWIPGPHNQLLELFIGGGLFTICFLSVFIFEQYKRLKKVFENRKFVLQFWGIVLIPIICMGLTTPIFNMYIYWCCLSITVVSLYLNYAQGGSEKIAK